MGLTRRAPRYLPIRARSWACAGGAALAVAGSTAAASGGTAPVPARDTFGGSIVRATGAWKSDTGAMTLLLHVGGSASATRPLSLAVHGAGCGTRQHCLRLIGTLTGSLTAQASIPDVGRRFGVRASGHVAPLGAVAVTGSVAGTGFIRRGRERLTLTLRTGRGTVTVDAQSPEVPGQTSP